MSANSKQLLSAWLKRRKLGVVVTAWGLLVAILAFSASSVTVREQLDIGDALPRLSQAVGDVAGLMSGQEPSFAVEPLVRDDECDITPVRSGVEYSRSLKIYAGENSAPQVAKNLRDRLADRYDLRVAPSVDGALRYTATLPNFVDYELSAFNGVVEWVASTGCRPVGSEAGTVVSVYDPPAESTAILGDLNVESADWSKASVSCGDLASSEGETHTVVARAKLSGDARIDLSMLEARVPSDGEILVQEADLFTYRVGDMSWAVATSDGEITVSSTSECDAGG